MNKRYVIIGLPILLLLLAFPIQAGILGQVDIDTPLKVIKKVMPDYPEGLRKRRIAGQVLLKVLIDVNGNVYSAEPWKSLNRELDEAAVAAIMQWKVEPVIKNGKPIRAAAFISVIFNALDSTESQSEIAKPEPDDPLIDKQLQLILEKCTEYCQKLSSSAFNFVCNERIEESTRRVERLLAVSFSGHKDLSAAHPSEKTGIIATHTEPVLGSPIKSRYVYDYQLTSKDGRIEERRIPLVENGQGAGKNNPALKTERYYSIKPIFAPAWLISPGQRSLFSYRLANVEKVKRNQAYVIEVKPRGRMSGDIKAGKVWVDNTNFRILKVEIESDFMAGYEQLLDEYSQLDVRPRFTTTHYYEVEKKGILHPSRSEILVDYVSLIYSKRELIAKAEIIFDKYRFFTVETEVTIDSIKKHGSHQQIP